MLILRPPRTSQPQRIVPYDPVALRREGAIGGFVVSGATIPPMLDGRGFTYAGTSFLTLVQKPGKGFFISPREASSGPGQFIDYPMPAFANRSFTLAARLVVNNATETAISTAGTLTLQIFRNGNWDFRISGTNYNNAGTWNLGQVYDIALVGDSSQITLYVDGEVVIQAAPPASATINEAFRIDDPGDRGNAEFQYCLLFNQPKSQAWVRNFNPWQLFAPEPRRIWVPSAAPATPVLSAAVVSASAASISQGAIDVPQLVGARVVPAVSPAISAGSILLSQDVAAQTLTVTPSIVQGAIQLPGMVAAQVLATPTPIIVQGLIDFPQQIAARTVTVTPVISQGAVSLIAAPAVAAQVVPAGPAAVVQGFIGLEGVIYQDFQQDAFALSYAAAWRRRAKTPAYFATRPSVSGTPSPGQTLVANPGTWAPNATFVYQWTVAGSYVRGATSASFTVRAEDAGKPIACCITANMPGGAKVPFVARV